MVPLLSRRPVTYRCALYGARPVVASFTANATTIRTTNPMTTKAVNGLISATIALEGDWRSSCGAPQDQSDSSLGLRAVA